MIEAILAVLMSFAVATVDAGEDYGHRIDRLAVVAEAIASVSGRDNQLAAFLIVQGHHETRWSLESAECRCKRYSCDHGKAHGYWNLHAAGVTPEIWWSYCGTSYASVRAGAARQRRYYDPRDLEASFRRCGGARTPPTARWPMHRATETLRIAERLRV